MSYNATEENQNQNQNQNQQQLIYKSKKGCRKQRRQILSEEEYTSQLESIVNRDYYPDLLTLQQKVGQQQEDDDNVEKKIMHDNVETVTEFHHRVISEDNNEFDTIQRKEVIENRNRIQKFFNDNNRLLQIAIKNNEEKKSSRNYSETPLLASDMFNAPKVDVNEKCLLKALDATGRSTTSNSYKEIGNNNGVFFTPHHHIQNNEDDAEEKVLLLEQKKQHAADTKRLMPPPPPKFSKKESPINQQQHHQLVDSSSTGIAPPIYNPLKVIIAEKRIEPSQTRFPSVLSTNTNRRKDHPDLYHFNAQRSTNNDDELTTTTTATTTDFDAETNLDTDDDLSTSLSVERALRKRHLQKERETLVTMTPLINPGSVTVGSSSSSISASPLITYGTIASTPLVISGHGDNSSSTGEEIMNSHTQLPTFQIQGENYREQIAKDVEISLIERSKKMKQKYHGTTTLDDDNSTICSTTSTTSKNRNKKRKKKIFSNSRSSTMIDRTTASLTPAAKSLLEKTTAAALSSKSPSLFSSSNPQNVRSSSSFSSALRTSYTPQRQSSSSSSSSKLPSSSSSSTKRSSSCRRRIKGSSTKSMERGQHNKAYYYKVTPKHDNDNNSHTARSVHTTATTKSSVTTSEFARKRQKETNSKITTISSSANITDGLLNLPS